MKNQQWELESEKFLNEVELAQLLNRADELCVLGETKKQKSKVRDAFLIYTAIFTGLRNSEICDLMVSDLRITGGNSHIVVRNGKGGKSRNVHIGKAYKSLLKKYLAWKLHNNEMHPEAHLLRTERSEKYCPSALWRRWKKHCPKTLHSSRHTYGTHYYLSSGSDLRATQKQLGHARVQTTTIYADALPQVLCEHASSLERHVKSIRKSVSKSA